MRDVLNPIPATEHQSSKPRKDKSSKRKLSLPPKKAAIILIFLILMILAVISVFLLYNGIFAGASQLKTNYTTAYATEKNAAYDSFYQAAFDRAEKHYHTSNTTVISIGNLQESEKLEVLRANDVEFITEDRDSNSGNVTAWLEVSGEGTFIIDLKAAEFIIDNERQIVLVRIPNPELTNVNITGTTKRWFADDWANGSYSEGINLALQQRNEASLQIHKALLSNQYIFSSAKNIAKNMIQNLVKQFNPDVPNLTVNVEFLD